MDNMQQDVKDAVAGMSLGDEAAQSGIDTIQGFINAANDMLPEVQKAYASLAQAAAGALGGEISFGVQYSEAGIEHNALGTTDAADIMIAGERGPELIVGKGGSTVYTAEETEAMAAATKDYMQLIALAPQMMSYFSTSSAENHAVSASVGSGGQLGSVSINPVYNVTVGSAADADKLRDTVAQMNSDLSDKFAEMLEDYNVEQIRKAYR